MKMGGTRFSLTLSVKVGLCDVALCLVHCAGIIGRIRYFKVRYKYRNF